MLASMEHSMKTGGRSRSGRVACPQLHPGGLEVFVCFEGFFRSLNGPQIAWPRAFHSSSAISSMPEVPSPQLHSGAW